MKQDKSIIFIHEHSVNPTNVGLDAGIIRLFHFLFNSSNVRPFESFHIVQPFVERPNTVEAA